MTKSTCIYFSIHLYLLQNEHFTGGGGVYQSFIVFFPYISSLLEENMYKGQSNFLKCSITYQSFIVFFSYISSLLEENMYKGQSNFLKCSITLNVLTQY